VTRRRRAGFTLIELMAVVALFILMAALVMPNLSLFQGRKLRDRAENIADHLEFARQRSVMTGAPHRLHIDMREGTYRLEWSVAGATEEPAERELDEYGRVALSLAPQRTAEAHFQPMPGRFGTRTQLPEELVFASIESDQGIIDDGEFVVAFEPDGTTDYAAITIEDEAGQQLTLEVRPLADAVGIIDEGR